MDGCFGVEQEADSESISLIKVRKWEHSIAVLPFFVLFNLTAGEKLVALFLVKKANTYF